MLKEMSTENYYWWLLLEFLEVFVLFPELGTKYSNSATYNLFWNYDQSTELEAS